MKKILVSFLLLSVSSLGFSQTNKTAYVDVFHILKKSPEYTEAMMELEKRAKDWTSQINSKKAEVDKMKISLSTERALLTQQLIDEKEDEIQMVQSELSKLQHEKFGIDGDYFKQKDNLNKPFLDQIHTISNDIATKKRYDIVLIKSEENTMIYANKRNDITDLVLKELERSRTRGKMSKKEISNLELQDKIEESKERQFNRREELKERQRQIESGNYNPSSTSEKNSVNEEISNETEAEKRIRKNKEALEAAKEKQRKIKEDQIKKIEEQKLAIKKKQEEQRINREKAIQENLEKRSNSLQKPTTTNTQPRQLTQKQQEALNLREQRVKEAKEKREKKLEERKIEIEKRKKEIEDAKAERLKNREQKK